MKPKPLTPGITMKKAIRDTIALAVLSAFANVTVCAENAPAGYIDFGKFSPPASGGEFVEVHIKSNLISMAARLVEKSEPDVAELIRGLQLIRVNVIGLDDGNRAEIEKRVKKIRSELDANGWERIVTAQKKDEDVGVYLKTRGSDAVEGVVVTVIEGNREAVLINIVGDIKPDKIAVIGERMDIEPLKKVGEALKKK
jgi:hypothetical protein